MRTIQELIENTSVQKNIEIYTTSFHTKLEMTIFNRIIEENPQYFNCINALASYTAQKWSLNVRNKLNLRVIEGRYIGIPLENKISVETALNSSKTIVEIIENAIDKLPKKYKDILHKIYIENDDVSQYKLDMYFEEAVNRFCEISYKKINKQFQIMDNVKNSLNDDIEFVNFDMKRLMELKKDIKYFNEPKGDIHYKKFYNQFTNIVEELKTYPCKKDVYECTKGYLDCISDYELTHIINKSNTYVRSRYKLGLNLIGFVLWGYADK